MSKLSYLRAFLKNNPFITEVGETSGRDKRYQQIITIFAAPKDEAELQTAPQATVEKLATELWADYYHFFDSTGSARFRFKESLGVIRTEVARIDDEVPSDIVEGDRPITRLIMVELYLTYNEATQQLGRHPHRCSMPSIIRNSLPALNPLGG